MSDTNTRTVEYYHAPNAGPYRVEVAAEQAEDFAASVGGYIVPDITEARDAVEHNTGLLGGVMEPSPIPYDAYSPNPGYPAPEPRTANDPFKGLVLGNE